MNEYAYKGKKTALQALERMRKNVGVGKLLVAAALREHHRILDNAIKVEDWSRAEALFVQASIHQTVSLIAHALPHSAAGRPAPSLVGVLCRRLMVGYAVCIQSICGCKAI